MMIDRKIKSSAKYKAATAILAIVGLGLCIACVNPISSEDGDPVYETVDQMPAFAGCDVDALNGDALKSCSMEKLIGYITSSFSYPKEEEKKGIEGKVLVQFVINKKGEVEHAEVIEKVSSALDRAALAMVEQMPNWSPGVHEGKKVNVKMVLPVKFALTD